MVLDFFSKIKKELEKGLPGIEAQKLMAPPVRFPKNYNPVPKHAKKSAVLILMFPLSDIIYITLIKRSVDGSVHSGQLAFPGGKAEAEDKSIIHTALREANEEVGIISKDVKVLGLLTPLFIPVSNYSIFPILGYLNYYPDFTLSIKEVQEVIEVNIDELFNPKTKSNEFFSGHNYRIQAPCYKIGKNNIWGATAMILSEFEEVWKRVCIVR